jgi:hypothetical protein
MLRNPLHLFILLSLLTPAVSTAQEKAAPAQASKPAAPPAQTSKPAASPAQTSKPAASPEPAKPAAAPAEVHWLQDKRGCKFANPTPKPNETVTWSGACADGYMQGKGVLQFLSDGKPGARYEGTLTKGRLTGRGVLVSPDKTIYDGDWVDGKPDGYGAYTAADGSKYEGAWTGGQFDGPGSFHSAKGEVVRGVWENGKLVKQYKD